VNQILDIAVLHSSGFVREGIVAILADEPDLRPRTAADADAAVSAIRQNHVVIVDASHAARVLASANHDSKVIVVIDELDVDFVVKVIEANALGMCWTDESARDLIHCIRQVNSGIMRLPSGVVTAVIERLLAAERSSREAEAVLSTLTPRELEILGLLAEGLGRKKISERLGLSPNTVRTHMQNLLPKLSANSQLEASSHGRTLLSIRSETDPST
jgi:DNA-binding NarL/FixJ family response regulator